MYSNSGQFIPPPTDEEREALAAQARRNQAKIDAERAAQEAEQRRNVEKQKAQIAEQFKGEVRARYLALSDADFERLWNEKLRDEALIAHAQQTYATRIAGYQAFI